MIWCFFSPESEGHWWKQCREVPSHREVLSQPNKSLDLPKALSFDLLKGLSDWRGTPKSERACTQSCLPRHRAMLLMLKDEFIHILRVSHVFFVLSLYLFLRNSSYLFLSFSFLLSLSLSLSLSHLLRWTRFPSQWRRKQSRTCGWHWIFESFCFCIWGQGYLCYFVLKLLFGRLLSYCDHCSDSLQDRLSSSVLKQPMDFCEINTYRPWPPYRRLLETWNFVHVWRIFAPSLTLTGWPRQSSRPKLLSFTMETSAMKPPTTSSSPKECLLWAWVAGPSGTARILDVFHIIWSFVSSHCALITYSMA